MTIHALKHAIFILRRMNQIMFANITRRIMTTTIMQIKTKGYFMNQNSRRHLICNWNCQRNQKQTCKLFKLRGNLFQKLQYLDILFEVLCNLKSILYYMINMNINYISATDIIWLKRTFNNLGHILKRKLCFIVPSSTCLFQ